MTEERRTPEDERALNSDESWGQGPDSSHPETAGADALPRDAAADPTLGVDDPEGPDEPPLT